MSDASRQEDIEKFIRQSILGVELVDTQFHLFSARSVSSGRIANPRVLSANNILLTKSSRFFSELLSSPTHPSDPTLVDIGAFDELPKVTEIDDYGYASDSDLDDDDAPAGTGNPELATKPEILPPNTVETEVANDEEGSSEADSESFQVASDILDSEPEMGIRSPEASSQHREQSMVGIVAPLRATGSRHIHVKDTAFQTWYTLLNYLYTGKVAFLPLKSAGTQSRTSSTSHIDKPRCSPKSMYRLACKVDLDDLRDEAVAAIRRDLTEHNILAELAHSLVSRHPRLLEMELDVLYSHIASPPVVTGLPSLARRIANRELPHGADIIVGLHSRLLDQHHPSPPSAPPGPPIERALSIPATEEVEPMGGSTPDNFGSTPILGFGASTTKFPAFGLPLETSITEPKEPTRSESDEDRCRPAAKRGGLKGTKRGCIMNRRGRGIII